MATKKVEKEEAKDISIAQLAPATPKEEIIVTKKKKIKDVADLPGVGEKVGEKLKKAGYIDLMSVAAASPKELGETANVGELTATKIINTAREELDIGFEKATEIYERRQQIKRIKSGSKNLDELLGGGFETQAVVEFHGAFGSGKTQAGFQIAINAQLPEEQGGIDGNCVFLDAESTFRPGRIKQMAEAVSYTHLTLPTILLV